MKNYYDKVLFVLALVLLGIGGGIFFLGGGLPAKTPDKLLSASLTGSAFEAIPPPVVASVDANWEAPADQSDGDNWVYGVFTPPKIWWDGKQWVAELPNGGERNPFGLHLDGLKQELYRIQLNGYLGADDHTAVIVLADEENGGTFNAKEGETVASRAIKVLEVVIERLNKDDGTISRRAKVTILDQRINDTVVLVQDVPLARKDQQYLLLQTDSPLPAKDWHVSKVDDQLTAAPDVTYTVKALNFDFDNPSVTVEKHYLRGKKMVTDTRTLTPVSAPAPAAAATPAK